MKIEALYHTGASIGVMSCHFYNKLENKPKLIACNRSVQEQVKEPSLQLVNASSRYKLPMKCSGIE